MPRQSVINVENNFSKGLITEATGLNFPENACTETYNCKFDYKGVATRRQGFDYESGNSTFVSTRNDYTMASYYWRAAGGDGNVNFVVVQIGPTLYFYLEDEDGPLSPGKQTFTIDLTSLDVTGNPGVEDEPCQFSTGRGLLFVAHPYCEPFYVTYVPATPTVTATSFTIRVRDFDGLPSTATYPDISTRPTSTRAALDDFDEYNLLLAGWGQLVKTTAGNSGDSLDYWDTNATTMPSLADVWWNYINASEQLDVALFQKDGFPTTRAPRGHYILNAFLQERDVASGIAGLSNDDVTSSYFRPRATAFYAGRVWWAGVGYTGFNSQIYFSQIIQRNEQVGYCYQEQDPTQRDGADLLDDDGGVVVIPDVGTVYKLFSAGAYLYVFADNGVWIISGSGTDGLGFKATDYTVRRLSPTGTISARSFVDVEGTPIWWNNQGIWTITFNQIGQPQVASLSKTTIHTFYGTIPVENKLYAQGAYNENDRIVQWLYRSTPGADLDALHEYDSVLNFDTVTGAFYPWRVDQTAGVFINSIVSVRSIRTVLETVNVIDSALDQIIDSTLDQVVASATTASTFGQTFKYLVTKNTSGTSFTTTWADEGNTSFMDWDSPGTAVSYESYFNTGYKVHGDAMRKFQSNYVQVYADSVTGSSCSLSGMWDTARSSGSHRWSTPQEIIRDDANYGVTSTRLKIRGHGRSLQLRFVSTAGAPFSIIGWGIWETKNAGV